MNSIKTVFIKSIRKALRWLFQWRIPGQYRVVQKLSPLLSCAQPNETIRIGRLNLELDLRLENPRYMYFNLYEPMELKIMHELIQSGDTVLDVGANIGFIAAQLVDMVGPSGHVIAFEPSKLALKSLLQLQAQDENGNLTVMPNAVGDISQTTPYFEPDIVLDRGFGVIGYKPSHDLRDTYQVDVVRLDQSLNEKDIEHLSFIKIDVEGYERQVLEGLRDIFAQGKRPHLMIETNLKELAEQRDSCPALLEPLGYKPYASSSTFKKIDLKRLPNNGVTNLFWCV